MSVQFIVHGCKTAVEILIRENIINYISEIERDKLSDKCKIMYKNFKR